MYMHNHSLNQNYLTEREALDSIDADMLGKVGFCSLSNHSVRR